MPRDKHGKFIKKVLDVKVRGESAYVSIWYSDGFVQAIFDKEDVPRISTLGSLCLRAGYVCHKTKTGLSQTSRIVMDCPPEMVVDHINGNKLDSRKGNLRVVTQLKNCQNRPRLNKNNSSGARGVVGERYSVALSVDGIRRNFGTFDNIEDAAKVVEQVSGRKIRLANKQSKTGMRGINVIRPKAWIAINGKRHYLGSFDNVADAEKAVNEKLKSLQST